MRVLMVTWLSRTILCSVRQLQDGLRVHTWLGNLSADKFATMYAPRNLCISSSPKSVKQEGLGVEHRYIAPQGRGAQTGISDGALAS